MKIYHPNTDNNGKTVEIRHPSESSNVETWDEIDQLATVTPGAHMPVAVGEIEIQSWRDAPRDAAGWEKLVTKINIDEPAYKVTPGKQAASGAVVIEQDGRVWIVSPTNRHGGYLNTFPKGKINHGEKLSLQANALKEVFEESGLKVELISFLCDSERDTSTTRLYLARRLTGNPADMGWESQAVHLVPRKTLPIFVTHTNDAGVLMALSKKAPLHATEAKYSRHRP